MKRITLGLLMASSCAAPAFAADQDQPAASTEAPAKASRFNIFVEGGFLFNNNVGALPYAEYYGPNDHSQETNTRYPFKNGSGDGYEISAGAGFHINDRISLNAAYTGLRTSRSANTGQFANYAINTVLAAGESPSANGVATSYNQARIHTETAGDIFDFNAGYDVGLGEGATATISAGVRYAEFHQSSTVDLFYDDSEQLTTAHRRSQFTGVGPELGAKAEYAFGHQGFSVEGSVLGSILFGRQKSLTSGNWTNGDGSSENDPLGIRQLNKASTAKTVNAEVGLTYNAQSGLTRGAALTFGYKVSYYAGVVDTGNGSSGDGLGRYGKVSDDILSHGPFIRLSYKR